jgi:hypothetical protein
MKMTPYIIHFTFQDGREDSTTYAGKTGTEAEALKYLQRYEGDNCTVTMVYALNHWFDINGNRYNVTLEAMK